MMEAMMSDYEVFNTDEYNELVTQPKNSGGRGLIGLDYARLKTDTGIEKFKFEVSEPNHEGYLFDFLPFPATPKHPRYKKLAKMFDGKPPMDYQLSMFMHMAHTGKGSYKFFCPDKNFGLPCPVCEEKRRLFDKGGEWKSNPYQKEIKALNDTQRDFFLVYNREDETIYVVEYSSFLFGEHLRNKLARSHKGKSNIILPDPSVNGHSVRFWVEAGNIKDNKGNPVIGHINEIEFEERDSEVPRILLKDLPPLDEYLHQYSYDEIVSIMDGTFFLEDEEEDEDEDDEPVPASPPRKHSVPQEDKEEAAPRRRRTVEEDEDEPVATPPDLDSREARRAARKRGREQTQETFPVCPAGGEFGTDIDTFEECDDCEFYEKCEKRYDVLKDLATF
jgi:hypothetical protein